MPECRADLISNGLHLSMLTLLDSVKDAQVKSIYAQIMVQLCSSVDCVDDLLLAGIIDKLKREISGGKNQSLWNDVSLILLAIVALVAERLSLSQHTDILELLRILCVKVAPLTVIETCSKVLMCISSKFDEFNLLHPVVRGILDFSESEVVIESISKVLYYMSCSEKNIPLMLKDNQYVNVMIKIMRKGKIEVQEYIAHAMRSLCVMDRCAEILVEDDIISDLIVIAMLRTSSEEIKVVCSEAFYNMLCHKKTRLKLLEGDLWWALMRLCKQDSEHVRSICARALLNLSCDQWNIEPLRKHHILSFLRDVSALLPEEVLGQCLRASHNIISLFDKLEHHEVTSSIRFGIDGLGRCSSIDSIRHALILLLKCSQQNRVEGMTQEFINWNFIDMAKSSSPKWSSDKDCCLYITRIVWELSKHDLFTKSISFDTLDYIFCLVFTEQKLTFEISENVTSAFVNFVLFEKIGKNTSYL